MDGEKVKGKLPLAATAGVSLTAYQGLNVILDPAKSNAQKVIDLRYYMVGIGTDGKFNIKGPVQFWGPTVIGAGLSMLASKTGLNRKLARVPFVNV